MPQLSQSTRETVLERDGRRCRFCGVTEEQHEDEHGRSLDIHHIVPRRANGSDNPENLMAVCQSCHQTLESTQADALQRLKTEKMPEGHEGKIADLEQKIEVKKRRLKNECDAHNDSIGAFEELLSQHLKTTVFAVHETRFNTSRLVYLGVDESKAKERFSECENHTTMETATVRVLDWLSEIDDGYECISGTCLGESAKESRQTEEGDE